MTLDTTELRRLLAEREAEWNEGVNQRTSTIRELQRRLADAVPALLDAAEELPHTKAICVSYMDEMDRLTAEVARLESLVGEVARLNGEIDAWRVQWKAAQAEIRRLEGRG